MNIIDAVKSGRRFRRVGELFRLPIIYSDTSGFYRLNIEDILATDWEIEERKIEITESKFDEIAFKVGDSHPTYMSYADELKKRLFNK